MQKIYVYCERQSVLHITCKFSTPYHFIKEIIEKKMHGHTDDSHKKQPTHDVNPPMIYQKQKYHRTSEVEYFFKSSQNDYMWKIVHEKISFFLCVKKVKKKN